MSFGRNLAAYGAATIFLYGCATSRDTRNLDHKIGQVRARAEEAITIGIDASQRASRVEHQVFVVGNRLREVKEEAIPSLESRVAKVEESPHSYRVLERGKQYDVEFGKILEKIQSKYKDKVLSRNSDKANILYIGETPKEFIVIPGYDCNGDGLITEGKMIIQSSGRPFECEDKIFNDFGNESIHAFPIEKPEMPAEIQSAILNLKTVKIAR